MKSGNPSLKDSVFRENAAVYGQNVMTLEGTVNKTLLLLLFAAMTASVTWRMYFVGANVVPYVSAGAVGAFIFALIAIFKPQSSAVAAPIYALLEGLALGGLSAIYEEKYRGITIQAVLITFGVAFAMLLVYKTKLIQATENFKLAVVSATAGIALVYIVDMIIRFFGGAVPFIHEGGVYGILFSVLVVIIAAMNLVLDFDFIEKGAGRSAKHMEWYGAFGLMLTLVWLYLEILRLLAKARK